MEWSDSECAGPWLHRWALRRSWPDVQEEVCLICHAQLFTKVRGGRVDNYRYLRTHMRSALQTNQPRFGKEYGIRRRLA